MEALAVYDKVATYDDVKALAMDGPVAFVDMAGDESVRAAVHQRFGDRLVQTVVVGSTHHDAAPADGEPLPGAKPASFFAPDRRMKRRTDWDAGTLAERTGPALGAFIDASDWLLIKRHDGRDSLVDTFQAVLAGEARVEHGHVILPSPVSAATASHSAWIRRSS